MEPRCPGTRLIIRITHIGQIRRVQNWQFQWILSFPGVQNTLWSFYLRVFLPCGVCKWPSFKEFSQMARFPLFTDFFSNCDISRILYIKQIINMHVCNKTYSLKCQKIIPQGTPGICDFTLGYPRVLANFFKTQEMRHPRETPENTLGYPGVNGLKIH